MKPETFLLILKIAAVLFVIGMALAIAASGGWLPDYLRVLGLGLMLATGVGVAALAEGIGQARDRRMNAKRARRTPLYVVRPGPVTSVTDGQEHYVTASSLAWLYKVNERDCVSVPRSLAVPRRYRHLPFLLPRDDGAYPRFAEPDA